MALNPELIGATLTFKMCAGEPVTGILYAYDDASNSIAITEHVPGTTLQNIRILQASAVLEVQVVTLPKTPFDPSKEAPLKPIDSASVDRREAKEFAKLEAKLKHTGKNVTEDAQFIFDELVFTLDCAWDGTTIVIMGETTVTAPYGLENVSGGPAPSQDRVKQVLKNIRSRQATGGSAGGK